MWYRTIGGAVVGLAWGALVLIWMLLAGCADAADKERAAPPWQLPRFDGSTADEADRAQPPPGTLEPGPVVDYRTLYDLVISCYPTRSWWRPEVALEGRLTQGGRKDNAIVQSAETSTYVGIVARVPLYSAVELDRERERERSRRGEIAAAVGKLVGLVADREVDHRELELLRAIEDRSGRRVAAGVAETAEQIAAIRSVAQLESKIIQNRADLQAQALVIVGMCKDRGDVENVVMNLIETGWPGQ
jgi:hypothetical protein